MKLWRSKWIVFLSVVSGAVMLSGAGGSSSVVGSSRCRECHEAQYEVWQKSPHAKSISVLSDKQKKDARCLKCHSTGEGKLLEVGCEACHGGGRFYSFPYVMKDRELSRLVGLEDPADKTCLRCHTQDSPMIRRFVVKDAMNAIKHWTEKKKDAPKN